MTVKVDLLVIDPQLDFIDTPGNPGSLAVAGAHEDMLRLAQFITRAGKKLNDIHVTLDTHRRFDVAHPSWWRSNITGKNPAPFTLIGYGEVGRDKTWMPVIPSIEGRMKDYVAQLHQGGRYPLCIWPYHCLIGTPGYNIHPELDKALARWEEDNVADIDFVTKGSNPYTEHYSAVQAEIPDPDDPSTLLNKKLIDMLSACDVILVAGEARSHCVANTVRDIATAFGEDNVKKMVLLNDCTSDVKAPGIEHFGPDFVKEMAKRGMQITDSKSFMT